MGPQRARLEAPFPLMSDGRGPRVLSRELGGVLLGGLRRAVERMHHVGLVVPGVQEVFVARQLVAGWKQGEAWQHYDPLVLDMYDKLGASVMLRHFARMHETVKLYRQAERILRELKLNDAWYEKPTEREGRGWGATEAIRGALAHWIECKDGKIKNYQIVAPTTWNVGPRTTDGIRGIGDGRTPDDSAQCARCEDALRAPPLCRQPIGGWHAPRLRRTVSHDRPPRRRHRLRQSEPLGRRSGLTRREPAEGARPRFKRCERRERCERCGGPSPGRGDRWHGRDVRGPWLHLPHRGRRLPIGRRAPTASGTCPTTSPLRSAATPETWGKPGRTTPRRASSSWRTGRTIRLASWPRRSARSSASS